MVECCISVLAGERSGCSDHTHRWFSDHTLITSFLNIQETTFELVCTSCGESSLDITSLCLHSVSQDCRQFLTLLNSKAGMDRRSTICTSIVTSKPRLHVHCSYIIISPPTHSLSLPPSLPPLSLLTQCLLIPV